MHDADERLDDLVTNLAIWPEDIRKNLDKLSGAHLDLLHAAIGISGEVAELIAALDNLDRANLIEELGDIEFFLLLAKMAISDATGFDWWSANLPCDYSRHPTALIISAGNFLDFVKKIAIYGQDFLPHVDSLRLSLGGVEAALEGLYDYYYLDREEVIEEVCAKLEKRYPSGAFTKEDSILRADKQ